MYNSAQLRVLQFYTRLALLWPVQLFNFIFAGSLLFVCSSRRWSLFGISFESSQNKLVRVKFFIKLFSYKMKDFHLLDWCHVISSRWIHDHLRARGPAGVEPGAGRDPSFCGGRHRRQRPRQRQQLHRPLTQAFTPRHPDPGEKSNHESFSARGALIDQTFWRLDKPVMNECICGRNTPLSFHISRRAIVHHFFVFKSEYVQVIIVGNVADQVKFSELTLDMFRMLQTLEREPQDEMAQVQT